MTDLMYTPFNTYVWKTDRGNIRVPVEYGTFPRYGEVVWEYDTPIYKIDGGLEIPLVRTKFYIPLFEFDKENGFTVKRPDNFNRVFEFDHYGLINITGATVVINDTVIPTQEWDYKCTRTSEIVGEIDGIPIKSDSFDAVPTFPTSIYGIRFIVPDTLLGFNHRLQRPDLVGLVRPKEVWGNDMDKQLRVSSLRIADDMMFQYWGVRDKDLSEPEWLQGGCRPPYEPEFEGDDDA